MTIRTLVSAAAALGAAGPGIGGPSALPPSYVVEITGTADAGFAGECTVEREGEPQRIRLEGAPPLRQELTGRAVACRLSLTSDSGRVVLSLRRLDGGASQTATLQGRGSSASVTIR